MNASEITVRVRLFARYAEVVGLETTELTMPVGTTVQGAVRALRERVSAAGRLPDHVLTAVNMEHVTGDRVLRDDDEIALLPPLAGG